MKIESIVKNKPIHKRMIWTIRLLIPLLLFTIKGFSKDYHFERKSPNAGFAFNQLNTIVEDENGAIWFGSTNGLYKYNSRTIERFTISNIDGATLPSNFINKLYVDDHKNLWICTDKGLCTLDRITNSFIVQDLKHPDISTETPLNSQNILQANDSIYFLVINFRLYKYNITTKNLSKQLINNQSTPFFCNSMTKDNLGQIWLGLNEGSIFRADKSLNHFIHFGKYRNFPISTFCFDEENLWIGYNRGGADKVSLSGDFIHHYGKQQDSPYKLLNNRIRKIIKRENGEIWFATFLGINILGKEGMVSIVADQFNNLPDNSVYDLMIDHQGGIWIGTWSGGLAYYSDYNYYFKHIIKIPFHSNLSKNNISSFTEDSNGIIWIGSETAGLKTYNKNNNQVESYDLLNSKGELINAKYLAIDKNERIWIGTFADGVWYKDKNQSQFRQFDNPVLKELNIIHKVLVTNQGLWFGTNGQGAVFYNTQSKKIQSYTLNPRDQKGMLSNHVWTILEDAFGNIWLGTDRGVCVKKKNSPSFMVLSSHDNSFQNVVYSLCETQDGEIWAGTKDNGILKIDAANLSLEPLDIEWNKANPEVYNLISDNSQNIWITSDQGIQMFNPRTNEIQLFDETDGVLGKNFNPNACLKASTGEIYFGGSYGFNIIQPGTIVKNPFRPKVFLSNLKINTKSLSQAEILEANSMYLPDLRNLSLKHSQNSLSFSFVMNNYVKSSNNNYQYRLLNYQDEWRNLETKTEVDFTKIPPGEYQLEVLASNNNGLWSIEPYVLNISIVPPFWRTYLAYTLYFLILALIIYLLVKESFFRAGLQKKLLVERFRHDAEEKLFQEKQKFFTNISHEFRTPLTLILSPINILFEHFKQEVYPAEHLSIIKRNADRLLRLTNEILDFRLIETGKIKLKEEPSDIISICKNTYDCFAYAAIEKEINYIFSSKYESLELSCDAVKIEKIIYNLLSNAFKFSADKSQIIISIDSGKLSDHDYNQSFYTGVKFTGDCLEIKVKDFGKGIAKSDMLNIFDRFSSKNEVLTAGTGLGLHISQEYIRLHGGNIIVSSVENKETTFIVNIPLLTSLNVSKQNILIQPSFDDFKISEKNKASELTIKKPSEIVILLIEDHLDLRKYLKNILSNEYKVLTASNGTQGYEIALEIIPNLIISDVMMPGMDGITLTKKIKEHKKTSHIPIIILTALTDTSSEIDGISKGADSYLTKPVDEKLLFAHIHRLIEDRKKIKDQLIQNQETNGNYKNKPIDKLTFVEKLELLVLDNLQNPQFSVEELAEKLNISRSSLHRKLKKDINKSVTEFIREVRIRRAIELMKTKKYNLDEICFFVGYNSHSYFTRSFKKIYGKTPKEFYDDLKSEM